ncbi:MAG: ATP-dependent Clp protease ATP-binding subunit, partial [Clostridia bacterium]|nr:ATP-dependent Clp protease ATP-binding subunit [Clostridia bacterium]
ILFIDEIHNLIGAGSAEGAVDAANILKPVLARGKIKLIGATTAEEYRRNIEKDAALERRFQTVNIEEPSMEDCLTILKSIRPSYEKFHRVKISDEALSAAVEMSVRYITDRFLPDKAIDLVDEAAAGLNMKRGRMSEEEIHLEENLRRAGKEKINAVSSGDFEKAAVFREKERAAANELLMKRAEKKDVNEDSPVLLPEHIASEVSSRTKIPVGKLCESDAGRLSSLEEKLGEAVIGQEDAVKRVAFAVRRSRAGLSDPERPVGTFLFSGPSGVGKTALAKALAECVFGSKDAMIKLDMSEYTEKHSLSRLIGAPPGYTGFDDGGQLVNKIRRMPYSVLLFDEIEKAHPDTFGFLLPVLEEGILTASDGKKADCRNCIIIMTSNAGASKAGESPGGMGFYEDTDENRKKRIEEDIFGELKNIFPPEFRGRIDDIIVFQRLSEKSIGKIAVRQLDEIKLRLKKQGISLITDDSVSEFLGKKGNDKNYGARNLRRLIRTEIEDPVSSLIYEKPGIREIKCTCTDGKLSFSL